MGLSHWLREHGPKTGSGTELPKGVRSRGKIKNVVFRDKNGTVIQPAKKDKKKK